MADWLFLLTIRVTRRVHDVATTGLIWRNMRPNVYNALLEIKGCLFCHAPTNSRPIREDGRGDTPRAECRYIAIKMQTAQLPLSPCGCGCACLCSVCLCVMGFCVVLDNDDNDDDTHPLVRYKMISLIIAIQRTLLIRAPITSLYRNRGASPTIQMENQFGSNRPGVHARFNNAKYAVFVFSCACLLPHKHQSHPHTASIC